MTEFDDYHVAYDFAAARARSSGIDQLIAKRRWLSREHFVVSFAPRPENTFGSDLMAERVTPRDPIIGYAARAVDRGMRALGRAS